MHRTVPAGMSGRGADRERMTESIGTGGLLSAQSILREGRAITAVVSRKRLRVAGKERRGRPLKALVEEDDGAC